MPGSGRAGVRRDSYERKDKLWDYLLGQQWNSASIWIHVSFLTLEKVIGYHLSINNDTKVIGKMTIIIGHSWLK